AERQRQLRCGPLARGTETELDIVAREEAFTVFHETAGQLLEGRGARVQRPDGIGERAPQLLRSAGDLLGDPALLTLVESAGRDEPGEDADAAEAGAELVVQVQGDPRALAFQAEQVRQPGAISHHTAAAAMAAKAASAAGVRYHGGSTRNSNRAGSGDQLRPFSEARTPAG